MGTYFKTINKCGVPWRRVGPEAVNKWGTEGALSRVWRLMIGSNNHYSMQWLRLRRTTVGTPLVTATAHCTEHQQSALAVATIIHNSTTRSTSAVRQRAAARYHLLVDCWRWERHWHFLLRVIPLVLTDDTWWNPGCQSVKDVSSWLFCTSGMDTSSTYQRNDSDNKYCTIKN